MSVGSDLRPSIAVQGASKQPKGLWFAVVAFRCLGLAEALTMHRRYERLQVGTPPYVQGCRHMQEV